MKAETKLYLCSSCDFLSGGKCLMTNRQITAPNNQFCDLHRKGTPRCTICGGMVPNVSVISDGKIYCLDCYKQLDTCATCQYKCGLETDNSGIPKQVMGNFKMNGMQYQGPVANPVLIEKYCRTCKCNINNTCHRKTNTKCENYL